MVSTEVDARDRRIEGVAVETKCKNQLLGTGAGTFSHSVV